MEEKTIISLFTEEGRKRHTCIACESYKREIRKGNKEALIFYMQHIYDVARRGRGNTFVIRKGDIVRNGLQNTKIYKKLLALPGSKEKFTKD